MNENNPISVQQAKMVRLAAYPVILCIVGFIGFQLGIIGESKAQHPNRDNNIAGVPSAKVKGFEENKYSNSDEFTTDLSEGRGIKEEESTSDWTGSNENLTEIEKKRLIGDGYKSDAKTKEQILSEHSQRTNQLLLMQNKAIQDMYKPASKTQNQLLEERNIANAQRLNDYALELSNQNNLIAPPNQSLGNKVSSSPVSEETFTEKEPLVKTEISQVGGQNVVNSIRKSIEVSSTTNKNAFFGLRGERKIINDNKPSKNIEAVVHGEASMVSVMNGSNVKLRVTQDFKVNGEYVPKNTIITGSCAINNDRIFIGISYIRLENQLIELRLKAVDLDGLDGIYVPNLNTKNQAKQNFSKITDAVSTPTVMITPSNASAGQQILGQIASQSVSTTISGVKQLITQKTQVNKVSIKANHRLLLVPVENQ